MPQTIKQPKGTLVKAQQAQVNLVWKQTFGKERTQQFRSAQAFVDSECIRKMVPYTPAQNNILYKSPVLATKIGSGRIYYQNPYARYQYHGVLMVSSRTGSAWASQGEKKVPAVPQKNLQYSKVRHPKACRRWFEVMKKNHLPAIGRGAAKIMGARYQ